MNSPVKTHRSVRTFAIASFLNDLGADMIFSVWPLFLTQTMGASMTVVGFIDGLGDVFVSVSQAVSGYFSDRLKKRKIFIWIGYLFAGLAKIGYSISKTWVHVIPFRIFDRSGKIRDAPRDAMVADLTDHQNRGKSFGIIRAFDNLGAVCGILLSMFLIEKLGYRTLFFIAALPSILASFLILITIKDPVSPKTCCFPGLTFKNLTPRFQWFILTNGIFSLGTFSYSFLLLFANQAGFSLPMIPALYLLFNVVASLFSYPAGLFCDRFGRKRVLFTSFLLWGLTCLLFIFNGSLAFIIASFVFYGLHKAFLETSQKTFASDLLPAELRASGLGAFKMIIGLLALPASLLAGWLSDAVSRQTPFFLSLFLTVMALFLLIFLKEDRQKIMA